MTIYLHVRLGRKPGNFHFYSYSYIIIMCRYIFLVIILTLCVVHTHTHTQELTFDKKKELIIIDNQLLSSGQLNNL